MAPTITIEDVDQASKEVLEDSNTQNGQPMPGAMPTGPAPAIPDWYKVGWRAHAGIDNPIPTDEERDKGIIDMYLSEMYYGDWYHSMSSLPYKRVLLVSHYI